MSFLSLLYRRCLMPTNKKEKRGTAEHHGFNLKPQSILMNYLGAYWVLFWWFELGLSHSANLCVSGWLVTQGMEWLFTVFPLFWCVNERWDALCLGTIAHSEISRWLSNWEVTENQWKTATSLNVWGQWDESMWQTPPACPVLPVSLSMSWKQGQKPQQLCT